MFKISIREIYAVRTSYRYTGICDTSIPLRKIPISPREGVDAGVSFTERSQRRQEEIESLQEALKILGDE